MFQRALIIWGLALLTGCSVGEVSTDFSVKHGGAKLVGESVGHGTAVVFLHAGVTDRRMYTTQLGILGREYRAVAYDRRGFGETSSPNEPFSHVADLEALLDALEISSAVLVGCSQGGRIAVDFSLLHPERVEGLVLVSTAISGAPPSSFPDDVRALLDAYDTAYAAGDLERVNAIDAHLWLDGPSSREGRVAGEVRELFLDMNGIALRKGPALTNVRAPASAYERLPEIDVPVLLIHGDLDFRHIQKLHEQLARVLPDTRSHVTKDAAHLLSLERPDPFNAWLSEFLVELERGPGADA